MQVDEERTEESLIQVGKLDKGRRRGSSSHSSSSRNSHRGKRDRKPRYTIEWPDLRDPLVTLAEFVALQRRGVPQDTVEKYYTNYKEKHEDKQLELFFEEHKVYFAN